MADRSAPDHPRLADLTPLQREHLADPRLAPVAARRSMSRAGLTDREGYHTPRGRAYLRLTRLSHVAAFGVSSHTLPCGESYAQRYSLTPTCDTCAAAMSEWLAGDPARAAVVAALRAAVSERYTPMRADDAGILVSMGSLIARDGLPSWWRVVGQRTAATSPATTDAT